MKNLTLNKWKFISIAGNVKFHQVYQKIIKKNYEIQQLPLYEFTKIALFRISKKIYNRKIWIDVTKIIFEGWVNYSKIL